MTGYFVRRVAQSVLVLWGVATVTFVIVHLASTGNPVRQALGLRASPAAVAALQAKLGLDRSLAHQYVTYLDHLIHGHLGYSLALNTQVGSVLSQRVGPSLFLVAYGLAIALVLGIPLGIVSAVRRGRLVDHVVRALTTFSFGMPTFWLGLMLALLLGQELHWFPVSGYRRGFSGEVRTLTLPALTLGLSLVVIVTRTLRANMIDVLGREYIEAVRSRGMSERRILFRHALRNAIMPTLTILSALIGYLLGFEVVIEAVFQIPGIGTLLVHSIVSDDFEMVQALALVAGTAVIVCGLAADVLQAALDPRVRLSR